ncbi:ecdysone 20-monooxygenase [Uranotaenia lowii]|uniref:ecdysone 20-monooxygenase n=1 Tax=Uranotaenia lowii TaxID=190385 RepID=UPI00247AAE08|nr:ecdysone 20-monooxygenase [Uranotaenia lowii]XP_055614217.1 ecdysone 20-monooxygenase [Uranotaenia lowii]
MSIAIILFYVFVTACMLLSYNPKPRKILEAIKGFLVHLGHTNEKPRTPRPDQVGRVWDIPGPKRLPLIGTKWTYMTGRYKLNKQHEAFADLNRRYGKIVLEQDQVPVVHLFDREDMEKVLRFPSKYPFRPPTEIIAAYRQSRPDRFASVGIVNLQGPQWHDHRVKLTSAIMSRKILQAFLPTMNQICDEFVELIRNKRDANGDIRDFQDYTNTFALEFICCFVLGRRMGFLANDNQINEKFLKLATAVKSNFVYISRSYYELKLWKYFPTKLYRDYVRGEETIYDIIAEIVSETLEQQENLNCSDDDVRGIFFSILQTESLDKREKITGIIDLIHASIATVSNTLCFLLYNLSHQPEMQRKIADEFPKSPEIITSNDLYSASFTKACIKESYRISPTTPCLARILEQEFVLSGYRLDAGVVVLCHTQIACQSEDNFKQAHRFQPERWLEQTDENQNVYKLEEPGASLVLPFGIGRRMCPGSKIVDIELTIVIAKILQHFEIEYRSDLDTQFQFMLAPKTPIRISFKDRNN